MISDPTLVMRVAFNGGGSHVGRDCSTVAGSLIMGHYPGVKLLDAKWSHTPEDWKGGWPRPRLTIEETGLVKAVTVLCEYGATVPPPLVEELLNIVQRVAK